MLRKTMNGNRKYLTRSRRDGRKVKREYYGIGPAADLVEALDGIEDLAAKNHADWWRQEQARSASIDKNLMQFFQLTVVLIRATFLVKGFRKHPTKWRFSQMMYDAHQPDGVLLDLDQLALALDKAEEGDREALASVRRMIRFPGTWEDAWGEAIRTTQMMVATITRADRLRTIGLKDRLHALRANWIGRCPTHLERLLVERLALAWLNIIHCQAMTSSGDRPRTTKAQKANLELRLSQAKKQLELAKKLLVLVQRDLPAALLRREKQLPQESTSADIEHPMDFDNITKVAAPRLFREDD